MAVLEELGQIRIRGYRALKPLTSKYKLWVIEVLAEAGFEYDSSISPDRRSLMRVFGCQQGPVRVKTAGGPIVEVPAVASRLKPRRLWSVLSRSKRNDLAAGDRSSSVCIRDMIAGSQSMNEIVLAPWGIGTRAAETPAISEIRERFLESWHHRLFWGKDGCY